LLRALRRLRLLRHAPRWGQHVVHGHLSPPTSSCGRLGPRWRSAIGHPSVALFILLVDQYDLVFHLRLATTLVRRRRLAAVIVRRGGPVRSLPASVAVKRTARRLRSILDGRLGGKLGRPPGRKLGRPPGRRRVEGAVREVRESPPREALALAAGDPSPASAAAVFVPVPAAQPEGQRGEAPRRLPAGRVRPPSAPAHEIRGLAAVLDVGALWRPRLLGTAGTAAPLGRTAAPPAGPLGGACVLPRLAAGRRAAGRRPGAAPGSAAGAGPRPAPRSRRAAAAAATVEGEEVPVPVERHCSPCRNFGLNTARLGCLPVVIQSPIPFLYRRDGRQANIGGCSDPLGAQLET